jgi:hypothetical protein
LPLSGESRGSGDRRDPRAFILSPVSRAMSPAAVGNRSRVGVEGNQGPDARSVRLGARARSAAAAVVALGSLVFAGPGPAPAGDPLEIRDGRQLFIDDFIVASSDGLTRVLHRPERHPANPVITGAEPWERWMVEVDGRPVLYDEESQELKMWYVAPLLDKAAPTGTRYKTCYATSKDGVHWTKPALGLTEWQGSRSNNILPWGDNWMRRPNVIKDVDDPDPERRFKMTYVDVVDAKPGETIAGSTYNANWPGRTALMKGYSRDGVHWRRNGDGKPWFRDAHNSNLLGWDPRVRRYVLFPRFPVPPKDGGGRARTGVGRSVSADFVEWSEPEPAILPGPDDAGKDFKGLAAFHYAEMYLGLLWVFDDDNTAEAELAASRDGVEWRRVAPGKFLFPKGSSTAWDCEWILPNAPVVWKDRIWIYYTGSNVPYGKFLHKEESDWVENGRRMQRAIGLATLPLDRFVSLHAASLGGELVTKPVKLSGARLALNCSTGAAGSLRVEIQDAAGRAVPGFALDDAVPITGDAPDRVVTWKKGADLGPLAGRAVRLRIAARDADLSSLRFSRAPR